MRERERRDSWAGLWPAVSQRSRKLIRTGRGEERRGEREREDSRNMETGEYGRHVKHPVLPLSH